METYGRFLFEFLHQFFSGFGEIFGGLWKGILNIFNIPEYYYIIQNYANDFKVSECQYCKENLNNNQQNEQIFDEFKLVEFKKPQLEFLDGGDIDDAFKLNDKIEIQKPVQKQEHLTESIKNILPKISTKHTKNCVLTALFDRFV